MTNNQKNKKENLHNLILRTRSCGTGLITQSRATNNEIERDRVRSCQAPQMPSVHTQEGCRLCYSVPVCLFFHFQCSDSGLALQLTCISVLQDSNINADRKIYGRHLASENALLPSVTTARQHCFATISSNCKLLKVDLRQVERRQC